MFATKYYVATDGNNSNNGSIDSPFWTISEAQNHVSAGDTVYIRGGSYNFTDDDISKTVSVFDCLNYLNVSGTEGNTINYWNYPGEHPTFVCTNVAPEGYRVAVFYVTGQYIYLKGIEITGIQVTITTHTESYGVYSKGSHNTYENLSIHDGKGTGIRHYTGGYNLFLNCDAYNNYDDVSEDKTGGNTDGFGCHPSSGGVDNVFKKCRAWCNSDDGFDCIRADEAVVFDSCQSFYNGYDKDMISRGDGNGFKAGGFSTDTDLPDPIPSHTIRFCLAVGNKQNGFYANHHLTGDYWYNNSAYGNNYNYNMVNRESSSSTNLYVNGYNHTLINNLGYAARTAETNYIDESKNTVTTNSFNENDNYSISSDDFLSLDEDLITQDRNDDGSLPETNFMKLKSGSSLINAGTDIGFSYNGSAPDLGAFEYKNSSGTTGITNNEISTPYQAIFYPNPASDYIYTKSDNIKDIKIIDLYGNICSCSTTNDKINVSYLPSGIYIIQYKTSDNKYQTQKLIKK